MDRTRPDPPLPWTTLTDQTYRVLKDQILRLEFPPGTQIVVPTTAHALGVSRTPVLDALKRLAGEGLVEIVPRRGTFVTQLTSRDLAEICDVRLMMECWAAEQLYHAGTTGHWLAVVQPYLHAMDETIGRDDAASFATFSRNDLAFHTSLVAATGNQRLLRTYAELQAHTHTARLHYLIPLRAAQAHREHHRMVAAFQRGDLAQILAAVRDHIVGVRTAMLTVLAARGGQL